MKKFFLDTNILIDLVDPARENHSDIVEFLLSWDINSIYLSTLSAHIAFYVLKIDLNTKQYKDLKSFLGSINLISLTDNIVTGALNIGYPDFEDSLQYLSAIKHCDYILTRDKKDFDKIKKLSPSNVSIVSDFKNIK